MFLRFVVGEVNEDSNVRSGVLGAAYDLYDGNALPAGDRRALGRLLAWFENHLATPTRVNRTRSKGYYRRAPKGISWLRDTATDHIHKMREVAAILERHGYTVEMLKEARPGYVVYEDELQVVAEPFADSAT